MMIKKTHPFHLVDKSPWPLASSFSLLIMTYGSSHWMTTFNPKLMLLGFMMTALTSFIWWRDITRESTFQGCHSMKVVLSMKWGMILFISSEVLFFLSFFWAFFHSSLSPTIELGMVWPPSGVNPFNPIQIPLLNTLILLSSGASATWAHHSLMSNKTSSFNKSMMITLVLGTYFSMLQGMEYSQAMFSISDSVYGSTFYMATGFHGIHVIIGTLFLMVGWIRMNFKHFSQAHHFGFEAAAWYWHFVDVVWMFLYISMYWWGS